MSLLKDLLICLREPVRFTPIRDGFHSNTFSYKDYSFAKKNPTIYKPVITTQTYMVRSLTGDDNLMQTVTSDHRAGSPLHAHLVSCAYMCYLWTCNGEGTTGQRPCLPLQWLADQKEVLTLYTFFKDINVTTLSLVYRKAFHRQGRRKKRYCCYNQKWKGPISWGMSPQLAYIR